MTALAALLGGIATLVTAVGSTAYLLITATRRRGDPVASATNAQLELMKQLLQSSTPTDPAIQAAIESHEGGAQRERSPHRPEAD